MNRTSRRTRLATAAVLAPLALGLAACGGDDDNDVAPAATSSSAPTTSESATPSDDSSDDGSDDGSTGDGSTVEGDVETAAQTALGEVDGTVFSVDRDDQGWDVTVVTADGVENDVELGPDATSVVRGPVADDDSDDAAEREMLLGASLDYAAAIEAASADFQGTVTGVDLSEDNGVAVWEVQFDEDTADETTVDVDASSGDVLRTERDD